MEVKIINLIEIGELYKEDFPRLVRNATARTLTKTAFLAREEIKGVIADEMTLRSRGFVRASTRYKGARYSDPVEKQTAYFGTLAITRATGWIEQMAGGEDKRARKWVKKARRGGRSAIPKRLRFTPDKEIPSLRDHGNMHGLLKWIGDNSYFDAPVMIGENDYNIRPGVVKFLRRRKRVADKTEKRSKGRLSWTMVRLAYAEDSDVKHVDILGQAFERTITKRNPVIIWQRNFNRELIKEIRRKLKLK